MPSSLPVLVHDRDGQPALVVDRDSDRLRLRTAAGALFSLPASAVSYDAAGLASADLSFSHLDLTADVTLHEVEERMRVDRVPREMGRVRVNVRTETRDEPVAAETWRETVEVVRVPVGRVVDAVDAPRVEAGVTIVPVYEEVLVVEKRLVLREELHLHTRREAYSAEQTVPLRRQTVDVERLPADGDTSVSPL